jgi:hypothetical protein
MKHRQPLQARKPCTDEVIMGIPQLTCRQCGRSKPRDEFRRRTTGREARAPECRPCHAEAERLRRRAKRSRKHRQEVNRDLSRLKRAKSARQVAIVCESMIHGFGGPDGFTKAWKACLQRDLNRGGFAALRHLEAVIRLVQHCEGQRHDYSQLTDEQLQKLADGLQHG